MGPLRKYRNSYPPQSIIHSMIEMEDSSVLAQLGWPDMKLPILYAMSWPERFKTNWKD